MVAPSPLAGPPGPSRPSRVPPVGRAAFRVLGARVLNVLVSVAAVLATVALAPLSLVGLVVAATSAASLEVVTPLHRWRRPRRALLTDLTHAVGNRYLVLPLTALLLGVLAPVAHGLVPDPVRAALSDLPWWAQLAVVFALTDLANYAAHRAMHRVPVLWRFHAVHHSSEHLDWLATARVHPIDLALNITVASLPTYALGYADQQPWLATFLFLYPFLAHADARLRLPVLDRVIVSPAFHHWHHADDPAAHDRNFGAILSVWDRLLGTAHEPAGYPERYGIGRPELAGDAYLGHLVSPLRRRGIGVPDGAPSTRPNSRGSLDAAQGSLDFRP
jgi:sterol desaturase/sphingolipid hydroxylase (fatty acid hydroxylase superfamily)